MIGRSVQRPRPVRGTERRHGHGDAIDNSTAHLAGALGVPACVLLPFAPDWRRLLARHHSPWYPTLRLFRQPKRGDGQSVMQAVGSAL